MRTVQIKISETEFQKYNFSSDEIKFSDLVEVIHREFARKAWLACHGIVEQIGLSRMTVDEINVEIKVVRDAKRNV